MKMRKTILTLASIAMASALPALANDEGDKTAMSHTYKHKDSTAMSLSSDHSSSVQSLRFTKLMDSKVTSEDGKKLGSLEDLLIDPQTGQIKFAVVGQGGFLGIGEDRIPIPWSAINVDSQNQFTLNVDKSLLDSAPKLDRSYSKISDPGFITSVDRYFESHNTAVGGSDSVEGTSQNSSESSSSSSTINDKDTEKDSTRSHDMDHSSD